ncbi:ABC transporter permease [Mahella sp.]|uniref:ABC transporter permease n=1 Tax=Mahella sp. TaxID=2798721 RepID=UPI0025C1D330|nr:ABC transporter permease [Mahella sp.]MBZ4664843.1 hypothetical protein [Mahella sp.]
MIMQIARYQWTRTRRWWPFPAAVIISLAAGLIPFLLGDTLISNTMTGMDVIENARNFLPFAMLAVMVASALSINRETDEGSDDLLWVLPVDNTALILGKFLGTLPIAGLAFAAFTIPTGAAVFIEWLGSGLPVWYIASELGIMALWWAAGILSAAVAAGFLGMLFRGLVLYVFILVPWVVTPVVVVMGIDFGYSGDYKNMMILWQLADWTTIGSELTMPMARDFYALLPYIGGIIWQKLFYIAMAGLILALAPRLIKRHRIKGGSMDKGYMIAAMAAAALLIVSAGMFYEEQSIGYDKARSETDFYRNHYAAYFGEEGASPADEDTKLPPLEDIIDPPLYIERYKLDIDTTKPPYLKIKAEFTLRNTSEKTIDRPVLTLRHNFDVASLTVDGQTKQNTRDGDWVYIEGMTLKPGQSAEVVMEYSGLVEEWRVHDRVPYLHYFVTDYGFMLPADYGWYPLTIQAPLGNLFGHRSYGDYPYYSLDEWDTMLHYMPDIYGSEVPTPRPDEQKSGQLVAQDNDPAWEASIIDPWRRPAYFDITLRKGGSYEVVTSIGEIDEQGGSVHAAGKGYYLTLLGWPMDEIKLGVDTAYRPMEYDGDEGIYPATVMRDSWNWLGISGKTARTAIVPFYTYSVIDGEQGFFIDNVEVLGYDSRYF